MLRGDYSNGDCVTIDATDDNGLEFSKRAEKTLGKTKKAKESKETVPSKKKLEVV